MSLPRLCTSLLVFTFALHAAAQSISASPKTATSTMGYPQALPALPEASAQRQYLQPLTTELTPGNASITVKAANPTLTAQLNAPCATLRMYGFTARDLKSYNPHSSTYTTCTPVAASDLKETQAGRATVKVMKAVPSTR